MITYTFPVERILYKVQTELPKAKSVGGFTTFAEVSPSGRVTLSIQVFATCCVSADL